MIKNKNIQFCMWNLKMKRKRTIFLTFRSGDWNWVGLEVYNLHPSLNFQGDKNKSALLSKIFLFNTFISPGLV